MIPAEFVTVTTLEIAPVPALPPTLVATAAVTGIVVRLTVREPATATPPLPPEPPILCARIADDITPLTASAPLLEILITPDLPPLPPAPPKLLLKLNILETAPPAAKPPLPPLPPKLWAIIAEENGPVVVIAPTAAEFPESLLFVTVTSPDPPPTPPEPAIEIPKA